jgi:hypothetical protein
VEKSQDETRRDETAGTREAVTAGVQKYKSKAQAQAQAPLGIVNSFRI